ncbi:MAG: hypothetical protein GF410_18285 [Chitinivibrionales bacterium]|nr:hypothetical protein [Chitinivibrionales bacterium]
MMYKTIEMVLGSTVSFAIGKGFEQIFGHKEHELVEKADAATARAVHVFFDKYKGVYGKESESFLARKENWDAIIDSLLLGTPTLDAGKINPNGYGDSASATPEAVEFFLATLMSEMRKDIDLERALSETLFFLIFCNLFYFKEV